MAAAVFLGVRKKLKLMVAAGVLDKNFSACERIIPFQSGETGEIGVGGAEQTIVLNGQSGEMSIGNEIGGGVAAFEHFLKSNPVLLGRLDQTDTGLIEPALHAFDGFFKGQRPAM